MTKTTKQSKTVTLKTRTLIIIIVIVTIFAYFIGTVQYATEYEVASRDKDYWKEAYVSERQNAEEWKQRAKEAERLNKTLKVSMQIM